MDQTLSAFYWGTMEIWYQRICGIVCPLSFQNIFCKTRRIHWSPNGPSIVGPWVARWIHGSHLATGRPYFSSTGRTKWLYFSHGSCWFLVGCRLNKIYNHMINERDNQFADNFTKLTYLFASRNVDDLVNQNCSNYESSYEYFARVHWGI